ncbi:hypothetical protein G6F57_021049 [Rhizopus arrhizus]|nr:hypothetical protein G6F39_014131 [Rhizopus arrhizus]KAG1319716.1 hypothetical protein G6F63_014597 [Rhizopus arrhizus]KAG1435605.1 hypothetical protein G6F57_021049 [Rhizopus arrhizus]
MVSQDRHLKGFNFPTELPSSHLPASFEYTLQRFDQLHLSEDAPNIDPSVEPSHGPPSVSPPSVKILAYADDALVFLKDTPKLSPSRGTLTHNGKPSSPNTISPCGMIAIAPLI